jgi:hypothetical protein
MLATDIIEILNRKPLSAAANRTGADPVQPQGIFGPKVMIVNERAGSGAGAQRARSPTGESRRGGAGGTEEEPAPAIASSQVPELPPLVIAGEGSRAARGSLVSHIAFSGWSMLPESFYPP